MTQDNTSLKSPKIALTLGDPAGIGAEIILKALKDPNIYPKYNITVIGSRSHLLSTYKTLSACSLAHPDEFPILDIPLDRAVTLGKSDENCGKASFLYLDTAISHTLQNKFQAIVTAPIAKSSWKAAGYHYPGQTEVLGQQSGVTRYGMMFVGRSPYTGWTLRTLLATTHIPLHEVSYQLTPELMSEKLGLLIDTLRDKFGIKFPHIAIAGLNPHSGENGQLGTEEKDWLLAWLDSQKRHYPQVKLTGLIPPDTMWVNPGKAWFIEKDVPNVADAYLALYHDQGLIPVKLMAFDQAINTTIGLPFVRTSPDHGTAFDIAGKGIAREDSLKSAIHLAAELAND
ncbi:MAG: 4-hydroxythreonine-4-phosphate dehydrogenase PdxA [Microcystaceae cyanobacterium]